MNTKSIILLGAIAGFTFAFGGEWVLFDGGKWKVSGGAAYDPGVKARLHSNQHATFTPPVAPGATRAEAEAKANGVQVSPTRKRYPNGSWIDLDDPGITGEDMPGYTGYYRLNGAPGENNVGSVFTLGTANYTEVTSSGADAGSVSSYDCDRGAMPGVFVELSHGLYEDPENNWGVDLAFGLQYFRRRNAWREHTSWDSSYEVKEGGYTSSIDTGDAYMGDDPEEDWNWRDGYYGSGEPSDDGFTGYAGPINGGAVSVSGFHGTRTGSASGSMYSHADYDNLELMLTFKPYYDVTDWFRVVGTVGVVVSRQDFDLSSTIVQDGGSRHYRRDFNQWDVYGIAGLGGQFRYDDFTLGFDFLARFFDDDLDVRDPYVNGNVERSNWFMRVSIGYQF